MTSILDEVFNPVIEARKQIMEKEGWETANYLDAKYEKELLEKLKQQLAERIKKESKYDYLADQEFIGLKALLGEPDIAKAGMKNEKEQAEKLWRAYE